MPTGKPITKEQKQFILLHGADYSLEELSRLAGCARWTVNKVMRQYQVKKKYVSDKKGCKNIKWQTWELEYLKHAEGNVSIMEMAETINRSENSVRAKLIELSHLFRLTDYSKPIKRPKAEYTNRSREDYLNHYTNPQTNNYLT